MFSHATTPILSYPYFRSANPRDYSKIHSYSQTVTTLSASFHRSRIFFILTTNRECDHIHPLRHGKPTPLPIFVILLNMNFLTARQLNPLVVSLIREPHSFIMAVLAEKSNFQPYRFTGRRKRRHLATDAGGDWITQNKHKKRAIKRRASASLVRFDG